jgi:two-component system response regulator PrrA
MVARSSPTILIVDDDSDVAAVTASRLHDKGYRVLVAHDGAEGLAIATAQHPDLILLDVVMPALDGHEVLTQLKRRRVPTRVIVYTGSAKSTDEVARLMKAGACAYLAKPSLFSTVLSQIKRALEVEPTLEHSFNVTATELGPKLTELEAKVGRLEHERSSLVERVRELEAEYAGVRRRSIWTGAAINVGYLSVAVLATYLLFLAGVVRADVALVILPIVLFLMLLLPIGKVQRFSARAFKSEAQMEMHRDSH